MDRLLLICVAVLFTLSSVSANSSEVSLRLVYGTEQSFPYLIGQGSTIPNPPGLAIDIIKQAAEDIGVKIELRRLPDKRLFVYLENGNADGNFIQSFNRERMKYGMYPMKNGNPDSEKRITTLKYFLYRNKDAVLEATTESLTREGVLIGAKRGFSIVGDLRALGTKVTEVESSESLYKMLESNRVNGIALQDTEGDFHVNSMKLNYVEKVFPALKTKHYYLMLSHQFVKKHPEIAEKLWNRIAEIRDRVTKDKSEQYGFIPFLQTPHE